jgi:phage shock protein PspC (stress-responsive transcriptional regulator)
MTESDTQHAPTRRLTRSSSDRMIAGVCGGLADYTGIDPVVFRVVVAVAAVLRGAGLVAYLVAWLIIPKEGQESHAQDWLGERARRLPRWVVIGFGIVAVLVVTNAFDGPRPFFHGGFGLLVLVGIGLWLWQRHDDRPPVAPPPPLMPPASPPAPATVSQHDHGATVVEAPPRRRRERSTLVGVVLSLALVVAGILAAIETAGGGVSTGAVFAGALITVGAGLLIGGRWGRVRLLIPVGAVLLFATAVATVADVPFGGGAGERIWRPTSTAELQSTYRLGFGHAVLDLRDLHLDGETRHVTATLGMGRLEVWLPHDARLSARAHVGGGRIDGLGDDSGGTDVTRTFVRGADVVSVTAGELRVDAKLGFGRLEVHR